MPQIRIQLDGFADERGDETYNFGLSEKRVDFVRGRCISAGVAPERIAASAHGESVADDDSVVLNRCDANAAKTVQANAYGMATRRTAETLTLPISDPTEISIPVSSRTSRTSADSSSPPASRLPPGSSQPRGSTRTASRTRASERMTPWTMVRGAPDETKRRETAQKAVRE